MKALPSSSKRTSTLSRVVPGTSLTIIRSAWASVLTNVLLPTLRRPTMATFITGSSTDSSSERRGQPLQDHVAAVLADSGRLWCCTPDQLAAPQPVELVGLRVELFRVGLVGHADDRLVDVPQPLGHLLVQRHEPVAVSTTNRITSAESMADRDLLLDLLASGCRCP